MNYGALRTMRRFTGGFHCSFMNNTVALEGWRGGGGGERLRVMDGSRVRGWGCEKVTENKQIMQL